METKQFTLSNGLPVIYIINPSTPLAYACLCVNAGAKDDKPSQLGLAHAVEHFLFMGSKHFSKQEINDLPSQWGTSLEGFTDIDFTSFGFRSLPDYFPQLLALLSDILINPTFPQDCFEKELEVIMTEMATNDDEDEARQLGYNLHTCFGMNRKKADILGTCESISRFTPETAYRYWAKYYTAQNSVLCIYANSDSYIEQVKNNFTPMVQGEANSFKAAPFSSSSYRARNYSSEIEVSLIFSAQENISPADEVLANILGGNYSSRLYQRLRNNQPLVYSVSVDIDSYACGDIFNISTICLKKNLEKVLSSLCEEIVSLKKHGVTSEDMTYAKRALETVLLSEWSNPENLVFDCAEDYLLNRFVPLDKKLQQYEQVTIEDIFNSIQNIFSVAPTYGIIGDVPNAPTYSQILKNLDL